MCSYRYDDIAWGYDDGPLTWSPLLSRLSEAKWVVSHLSISDLSLLYTQTLVAGHAASVELSAIITMAIITLITPTKPISQL